MRQKPRNFAAVSCLVPALLLSLLFSACGSTQADAPADAATSVTAEAGKAAAAAEDAAPAASAAAASASSSDAEEAAAGTAEEASALTADPEEAAAASGTASENAEETTGAAAESSGAATAAAAETAGEGEESAAEEKIFASAPRDFSFLYDGTHKAYITDSGAAQLAIDGDDSLVGLSVSVMDDTNMPEVSQIIEEHMFNETLKYQNAIAQPPAENEITMDGHTLTGYIFSYSSRKGETIDVSYYVETRDGRYIFYRTETYRHAENYWAGQEALEKAIRTLKFSYAAYGIGEAESGEIGTDNTPEPEDPASADAQAPASSAGADTLSVDKETPSAEGEEDTRSASSLSAFAGDYTFDIDEDQYLILSDEELTMVYTGGGMQMPVFQVDDETDEVPVDDIGTYVVNTKNDVIAQLQNRLTGDPKVVTFTIGERKFAGLEYSYSSVAGDRTIECRHYFSPMGDRVFVWYGLWNRGDELTPDLMQHAMETFTLR